MRLTRVETVMKIGRKVGGKSKQVYGPQEQHFQE